METVQELGRAAGAMLRGPTRRRRLIAIDVLVSPARGSRSVDQALVQMIALIQWDVGVPWAGCPSVIRLCDPKFPDRLHQGFLLAGEAPPLLWTASAMRQEK